MVEDSRGGSSNVLFLNAMESKGANLHNFELVKKKQWRNLKTRNLLISYFNRQVGFCNVTPPEPGLDSLSRVKFLRERNGVPSRGGLLRRQDTSNTHFPFLWLLLQPQNQSGTKISVTLVTRGMFGCLT